MRRRGNAPVSPARALVAPASLKGVLSARDAAAAVAAGFREAGVDADECPVADGGEGTAEALWSVLGGVWHAAPSPIRSAGPSSRGGSSFRTALRWSRRQRRSGSGSSRRRSVIRCVRRAAGWVS